MMNFDQYAEFKTFNYEVNPNLDRAVKEALISRNVESVRVLDYGCGDGKLYNYFLDNKIRKDNLFGFEISRKRIERCNELGWKNAIYIIDSAKLPYPDDFFDLVVMSEVIEHIEGNITEINLRELCRVMKKDGSLVVTTPNYPIKRFYDIVHALSFGKLSRAFDDPTHFSHYNFDSLRKLLSEYFENVELRVYKSGFLYPRLASNFFAHKIIAICTIKKR
jgi:ubiquinone/menaquinone biosynthesis C-methylase UbiE